MATSTARHGAVGHPARPDAAIPRWVDTSQLIGNDVQLTDRGLELSTDPEDLEDDGEELQFCNCCQGWLDPEEFFDEEEETWCMQCMDEDQQRLVAESS